MPCFIFGMYNTGYQHWLAAGEQSMPFWSLMLYGFLAVIPRVVVCYLVGLGIEFIVAQWRKEEIQEGFLVTGILIPMICPNIKHGNNAMTTIIMVLFESMLSWMCTPERDVDRGVYKKVSIPSNTERKA